ncbi:MAG TPA: LapA family protein [Burkholderiales bacterium]|nr:LapA family protein [Burkholderiales bacterium]
MHTLSLILKLVLFFLVITFAVKNTDVVKVQYFLGWEWQSPLVFVMLVAFCAGIVLGVAAGLPRIFRQRREIAALRLELSRIDRGSAEGPGQPAHLARGG